MAAGRDPIGRCPTSTPWKDHPQLVQNPMETPSYAECWKLRLVAQTQEKRNVFLATHPVSTEILSISVRLLREVKTDRMNDRLSSKNFNPHSSRYTVIRAVYLRQQFEVTGSRRRRSNVEMTSPIPSTTNAKISDASISTARCSLHPTRPPHKHGVVATCVA